MKIWSIPDVYKTALQQERSAWIHAAAANVRLLEKLVKEQSHAINHQGICLETGLINAVRSANSEQARQLLELGADTMVADKTANTPLHYAARMGIRKIVL